MRRADYVVAYQVRFLSSVIITQTRIISVSKRIILVRICITGLFFLRPCSKAIHEK